VEEFMEKKRLVAGEECLEERKKNRDTRQTDRDKKHWGYKNKNRWKKLWIQYSKT
jgi:hypothetical protein